MKKGLLLGVFAVAFIHAVVSLMFAGGFKSYFWYASFLASIVVAWTIGYIPEIHEHLTKKD